MTSMQKTETDLPQGAKREEAPETAGIPEDFAQENGEESDFSNSSESDKEENQGKGSVSPKAPGKGKWLRRLAAAATVLLYTGLVFAMFRNAAESYRGSAVVSMRYEELLATSVVSHAKFVMGNPDIEAQFTASYWYEGKSEQISTTRATIETPALFVDGEMGSVVRVDFLYGTYPSVLENRGLALSEKLAWDLFGGLDVVGATVDWYDEEYVVRGIFEGDDPLLLVQVDASKAPIPGFMGLELAGEIEGTPQEEAKAYALAAGLPIPAVGMGAAALPDIISLIAWLPVVALCLWFVVRLLMLMKHASYWKRQLVWFGALFAAALLLPRLLALLPPWLIPNQWSDMEHWRAFMEELNRRMTEWLSLNPFYGDVQLKKRLILQAVLVVPSLLAMMSVIRRWAWHMRSVDAALALSVARKAALREEKQEAAEAVADEEEGKQEAEG